MDRKVVSTNHILKFILGFISISSLMVTACEAKDSSITFKETRVKILDQYLAEKPEICQADRPRGSGADNHFMFIRGFRPWEALDIILNDIFCKAGETGRLDLDKLMLAAVTSSQAAEDYALHHDDEYYSEFRHVALSIIVKNDMQYYTDEMEGFAIVELLRANLGIYNSKDDKRSMSSMSGRLSSLISELIGEMSGTYDNRHISEILLEQAVKRKKDSE